MKKIIIILFFSMAWTQVFGAENTALFDDIESLLQESDSNVQQREAVEQQAKAEREWKYHNLINSFDFPQDTCGQPELYVPTSNAGFKRLAGRLNSWQRCEYRLEDADFNSLRQLILSLNGEWKTSGGYIYWNLDRNESISKKQLEPLWHQLYQRKSEREKSLEILHTFFTEHADNYHAEIEQQNREIERQNRSNFWLDALKGMEQGLREYNQSHYQQY